MADLDLDAIEARANAATKGTWFREYGDVVTTDPDPRDLLEDEPRHARVVRCAEHRDLRDAQGVADAEFIAHAREDVPALVAEVKRLGGESERLKKNGAELRRQYINEIAERGERVQDLAVRLAEVERERDELRESRARWFATNEANVSELRDRAGAAEARLEAVRMQCEFAIETNAIGTRVVAVPDLLDTLGAPVPAGTAQPDEEQP